MTKTPRLATPAGACDTHIHFYNARWPSAPTALITPLDAWIDDYRALRERLGLSRVVVVQPTTYGFDNACQLAAMEAFGEDARGVMVVGPDVTDTELKRLTALGVCGARFHMLPGGALPWEALEATAARVASFGWHVQLQFQGREFAERAETFRSLPTPIVVDHVGRFMPPVTPDDAAFRALLGLIDGGRCWVKLSAPYESSTVGPPGWDDVRPLARALVAAAPARMLWASNWPHPGQKAPPDEADLLDLLLDWADDEATRARILVDNPAALYGF